MAHCPDCDTLLHYTTEANKDFVHIFEICHFCGFVKAYVDYLSDDTGPIDWSGIDH